MNSITFSNLEKLQKEFDFNEEDCYEKILRKKVQEIFEKERSIEYAELLKKLDGVFPVDLFRYLSADYIDNIDFSRRCDVKIDENLRLIAERQKLLPPEHLANFEWRFSVNSIQKILANLNATANVCCLGTPSIANNIIVGMNCKTATLLDINNPIISKIQILNPNINATVYNATLPMIKRLERAFDCVITNPPWHLDYYKLFIQRALELIHAEGGDIILPLFPILSRHHAARDLVDLFDYIAELGCVQVETLGEVEFETPLFEKKVFECNNIPFPDDLWRTAELIKLKFGDCRTNKGNISSIQPYSYIEWSRIYDDKTRQYYAINHAYLQTIKNLEHFETKQLESISREEIEKNANKILIWSSNNQVVIKVTE